MTWAISLAVFVTVLSISHDINAADERSARNSPLPDPFRLHRFRSGEGPPNED